MSLGPPGPAPWDAPAGAGSKLVRGCPTRPAGAWGRPRCGDGTLGRRRAHGPRGRAGPSSGIEGGGDEHWCRSTNRPGGAGGREWASARRPTGTSYADGVLTVRGRVHGTGVGGPAGQREQAGSRAADAGRGRDGRFEAILPLRQSSTASAGCRSRGATTMSLVELARQATAGGGGVRCGWSGPQRRPARPVAAGPLEGRVVRGADSSSGCSCCGRSARPVAPTSSTCSRDRAGPPAGDRDPRCSSGRTSGSRPPTTDSRCRRELRRRGCRPAGLLGGARPLACAVPEGGIPVVVNSREWFDLLGRAKYYLDNMYQPDYHRKPEGQVIVQTFHGYPFKQMGHPTGKRCSSRRPRSTPTTSGRPSGTTSSRRRATPPRSGAGLRLSR